jgi:hypothetical protein
MWLMVGMPLMEQGTCQRRSRRQRGVPSGRGVSAVNSPQDVGNLSRLADVSPANLKENAWHRLRSHWLREVTTMRRMTARLVLTTAAACALAACATMRVSSHVERGVDFTRYQTFDWGPADALPASDPRLSEDRYFEDRVEGAIEKQMAARGYRRSEPGAVPDVRLHYHAAIDRRLDVNEADRRIGYCQAVSCLPGIVEYEAGTLVVDMVDTRTHRLIWRGWAQDSVQDVLGNRDRLARKVDQGVAGMFVRLPAAR